MNEFLELGAAAARRAHNLLGYLRDVPTLVPVMPSRHGAALEVSVILFAITVGTLFAIVAGVRLARYSSSADPMSVKISWAVLAFVLSAVVFPLGIVVGLVVSPLVIAALFAGWHWLIILLVAISVLVIVRHRFKQRAQGAQVS